MAITIPHSFTNGTIAEANEVNANFVAVKDYVDGLSDGTNIDLLSITAAKLALNSVTTTKIADGSVSYIKLDASVSQDDQIILSGQVFG
jgi:predicted transcriptional regulator